MMIVFASHGNRVCSIQIFVLSLLCFKAYSPEDMAEWINAINDVRAPKRASAPQVSVSLLHELIKLRSSLPL